MYILINGSFGVGKTTVARALRRRLPGAALFDPEWVGLTLMRMPGYNQSDFQHLVAWRRWSVAGACCFGTFCRFVVVPMAFTEIGHTSWLPAQRPGMGVMLNSYWEPRDGPTLRPIGGLGFLCDLFECRPLVFESLAVTVCPKSAGMPYLSFSSTRKSLFNSRGIP